MLNGSPIFERQVRLNGGLTPTLVAATSKHDTNPLRQSPEMNSKPKSLPTQPALNEPALLRDSEGTAAAVSPAPVKTYSSKFKKIGPILMAAGGALVGGGLVMGGIAYNKGTDLDELWLKKRPIADSN